MKIPPIPNAFEHIKKACDEKIAELYPLHLPKDIEKRYLQELTFLEKSEYLDDFEIFRLLSKEALSCSTILQMRDCMSGSFIVYLLGNNCFNPLPVHYYCPSCGHYEAIDTRAFGIDLPEKACPECGRTLFADGFHIHPEIVWGNDGHRKLNIAYDISIDFFPRARKIIEDLYPHNSVVPMNRSIFALTSSQMHHTDLAGYAILPTGTTLQNYPDLVSRLKNGRPCIHGSYKELENSGIKSIKLLPSDAIEELLEFQYVTGISANDITPQKLRNIHWKHIYDASILPERTAQLFSAQKPQTYLDMVSLKASSFRTISHGIPQQDTVNEFRNTISSEAYMKYPCFTHDDFFDALLSIGLERSVAFDISERIRRGEASSDETKEAFNALELPFELKEVASCHSYLLPRAHCVERILLYARIAYYKGLSV